MATAISVKNISKQYRSYERGGSFAEAVRSLFIRKEVLVDAVKNISFDIEEGSVTGLLGKNGAGKSTLIKIMAGVLYPTSGEVRVMGYDPFKERSRYVSNIGVLFGQKSQLIWDIPPVDSFLMNKAIYDVDKASYDEQLGKMTGLLEIGYVMKKPTRELSLGERMKCEFVMAMLHSPRVVFLDEPTIGLDILAKETIRGFIREMNHRGVTFILTTHDLEDIESLAQNAIIINKGEKVYEDSLANLKKHLGDKKTVSVVMKERAPGFAVSGADDIEHISDYEKRLLIDLGRISMNDFLREVSGLGEVADISIKEMGIEEIVKTIYRSMQ